MGYVLDNVSGDFSRWKDYWDIIIVGSEKPGFFFWKPAVFRGDRGFKFT